MRVSLQCVRVTAVRTLVFNLIWERCIVEGTLGMGGR